jgi:hypothetical protein
MHLAAGGWESSQLWIPLSVLVAVLVGAALIWLTYKLAFARQRLDYSVAVTPLVARGPQFAEQLRIYYGRRDVPLTYPRVVRIRLASRSAKDIGRDDFDAHAPLIIQLGTPAVAILSDSATGSASPNIAGTGSEVHIQPGLIRRKAVITISVLVDGKPDVTIDSPIRDCPVTDRDPLRPIWRPETFYGIMLGLLVVLAAILFGIWFAFRA